MINKWGDIRWTLARTLSLSKAPTNFLNIWNQSHFPSPYQLPSKLCFFRQGLFTFSLLPLPTCRPINIIQLRVPDMLQFSESSLRSNCFLIKISAISTHNFSVKYNELGMFGRGVSPACREISPICLGYRLMLKGSNMWLVSDSYVYVFYAFDIWRYHQAIGNLVN